MHVTVLSTPDPTDDQTFPSYFPICFAAAPPIVVNTPPAYKIPFESNLISRTSPLVNPPIGIQVLPLYFTILLAGPDAIAEKSPPT